MTWNIWRGGEQVAFDKVVEVIRGSNADIVAIQEAEGNLERLARETGYTYYSRRLQLLSRFPLVDPQEVTRGERLVSGEGEFSKPYAWVEIARGHVVLVSNLHLPSDADGPEALRDGIVGDKDVHDSEQQIRGSRVDTFCQTIETVIKAYDVQAFVLGDFNSPHHRDCPDQVCRVHWPATFIMEQHGFTDAYREKFPNVKTHPGLTWTTGYPAPFIKPAEQLNRIDFVWYRTTSKRPVKPVNCFLIGESGVHMHQGRHINAGVEQSVTPWPSDHRAVVVDFQIEKPAPVPFPMVGTIGRRIQASDDFRVFVLQSALDKTSDLELALVNERSRKIVQSVGIRDGTDRKIMIFSSKIGDASERSASCAAVVCRRHPEQGHLIPFLTPGNHQIMDVVDASSPPSVTIHVHDSHLQVDWNHTPGDKWDWIGMFDATETNAECAYKYAYLDGATHGSAQWDVTELCIDVNKQHLVWEVRLFSDDSNRWLASSCKFKLASVHSSVH